MDLALTDEQAMIRDAAADVLAERLRQFLELDLSRHQTSRVASEVASLPPANRR